ncbi:MAG: cysteine desulfurase [Acidobacteriota bacterium]
MTATTIADQRDSALDVTRLREEFPVLHQTVHGKPLVYLDNAASSQRPRVVAEAVASYYAEYASNVHRGVHALAERATAAYEGARAEVQRFLGAADLREVVFTRGTTEAINLVARSFARPRLRPGDEVLITAMEHHSNIVPWQLVCEEAGAKLVVVPIDDRGDLIVEEFERLLSPRTKIAAAVWISNALGTVNPAVELVRLAHQNGTPILIDGAQAAPHREIDVRALGCDFFCFSGHKTYAPGGIGVLYGRLEHLEAMPPWQGGGDMILSVSFEKTEFNHPPYRFEAGTPNVEGAIGLGAALAWLRGIGMERIERHEHGLLERATARVSEIPGVRLIGTARAKASVLSFVIEGVHAHDIGTVLDSEGIAVRAGHHCAQPVMERFGVAATARASFALYNTFAEVDALAEGIGRVQKLFSLS